jgi:hypothetical protein
MRERVGKPSGDSAQTFFGVEADVAHRLCDSIAVAGIATADQNGADALFEEFDLVAGSVGGGEAQDRG